MGSDGLGSALIEHWNGNRWRIVPSPTLVGSALLSIAAVSPTDIWAVGRWHLTNGDTGTQRPLIEHWNGARWRTVASPRSPESSLYGVAGLTPRDVWAVGDPGIEHWNGSAWTVAQSGPLLESVVAISTRNAWAVGNAEAGAPIEHWDGYRWARVPSHGGRDANLHAVAALSPSDIWAVGQDDLTNRAIAEHWNGHRWRVVRTPRPGSKDSTTSWGLNSLAAVSTHEVWGVGDRSNGAGSYRGLTERWNGRSWRVMKGMDLGSRHSDLLGIAAPSPKAVWAVGTSSVNYTTLGGGDPSNLGMTLAGQWNGRHWRAVRSPSPTGSSAGLDAVDSSSFVDTWAVGDSLIKGYSQGLAEHWNGARWSLVPTPGVSNRNVYLNGVEAITPTDAWAVGWKASVRDTHSRGLVEHWNGHRWSVVPHVGGEAAGKLFAVSADSPTDVWTVGFGGYVARWNGSRWRELPGPTNIPGRTSSIVAISPRDVWVSSSRAGTVDHWNGTGWTGYSNLGWIGGLAASSPREVWAVGNTFTGRDYPYDALARHWNGRSWHNVHAVSPTTDNNVFESVTAITPSNVWAVGYDDNGPLIEHWNGKRFRVVPSAKSIPDSGDLSGVDGSSAVVWAVGGYAGDGSSIPVAERYMAC